MARTKEDMLRSKRSRKMHMLRTVSVEGDVSAGKGKMKRKQLKSSCSDSDSDHKPSSREASKTDGTTSASQVTQAKTKRPFGVIIQHTAANKRQRHIVLPASSSVKRKRTPLTPQRRMLCYTAFETLYAV